MRLYQSKKLLQGKKNCGQQQKDNQPTKRRIYLQTIAWTRV